jgi:hypothetical protein
MFRLAAQLTTENILQPLRKVCVAPDLEAFGLGQFAQRIECLALPANEK